VLRPGRTVHEVPGPEPPLLALDDEDALVGEDEEVRASPSNATHEPVSVV
jgi:hypothetical protein